MLTHGNLLANLEQCQAHPGRSQGADDVVFGVLPLFHIFGLNVVLGLSLRRRRRRCCSSSGSIRSRRSRPIVQPRRHRRSAARPRCGRRGRPARRAGRRASATVRLATSGAAKLDPRGARSHRSDRFGVDLAEGYGLTEASPVVTLRHRAGGARGSASACRCPASQVRLVDADGERRRSSATPARSGCGARTCSPATGTTPRPPRARAHRRRLAAHRRRRRRRRRRLPVPRRPGQGPHHRVGLQRVPGRGRGGARRRTRPSPQAAVIGVPHPHSGEAVKAYVVVAAGRQRRGGRHHPPLRGAPGPLQVPAEGDVRRRDPPERHRQGAPQGAPRAGAPRGDK